MLLAVAFSASAQCIKGTVTDSKTGEPLIFVTVVALHNGDTVMTAVTDFDGAFVIKPIDSGWYDIESRYVGYYPFSRTSVRVKPDGFTIVEIKMCPSAFTSDPLFIDDSTFIRIGQPTNLVDSILLAASAVGCSGVVKAKIELAEYKIVSRDLRRLLDRVVECREHTYEPMDGFECKPLAKGTTCDLYIFDAPHVDTTWDSLYGYIDYLYLLYRFDDPPSLPLPLKKKSPPFQLDKPLTVVQVTTSYSQGKVRDGVCGYVEYRGIIFYIASDEADSRYLTPTGGKRTFNYGPKPIGIWDPPTWLYTLSCGHWYRWLELPRGF